MSLTEKLRKAKGLFIVEDESSTSSLLDEVANTPAPTSMPTPRRTIEQVVREQPGPNLEDIKVAAPTPTAPSEPIIRPDGTVNFNAIYSLAALPTASFTAEQVLELLASLPAELPLSTKRTALKVTLDTMAKTVGVTSETVVADASRKLASLATYADSYTQQATEYVSKAKQEIARLEAEIANLRGSIDEAQARQAAVQAACVAESDRLDDVLEFFSLDVAPSKYAPK